MNTLNINGYELIINPISPLAPKSIEVQYTKANPKPVQPSYTVEAAGGVVETFFHDSTTVETDEEKKAYETWLEEMNTWQTGLTHKLIRLFLLQGVDLKLTKKQIEAFDEQLEILEIEKPSGKGEKLFYLETFIVDTQEKLQDVIQAVLAETGVSKEALETAESLF